MMLRSSRERKIHEGRIAARDGVLIEYKYVDNGKDQTIAFVNGWGITYRSAWYQQEGISEYNLLFHNNRGTGSSGLGRGEYLHSCASDTADICRQFDIKRVNLVGHSMGGLIQTLFFNDYRNGFEVASMAFVNSVVDDPIRTFPFRGLLPRDITPIEYSFSDGLLSDIAEIIKNRRILEMAAYFLMRSGGVKIEEPAFRVLYKDFLSKHMEDVVALDAMRELGPSIGQSMSSIDVPALVLHSTRDYFVDLESARRIHDMIKGSRMHIFLNSTHAPMMEQPREFNELLLRFIGQHN